jgi:hypothetical protein
MEFDSKSEIDEQWNSLVIPSSIDSDDESTPTSSDASSTTPHPRKLSGEELVALRRREKSLLAQEATLDSAVALGLSESTFKLYVTLPNGKTIAHEFPTRYTVDQAKVSVL